MTDEPMLENEPESAESPDDEQTVDGESGTVLREPWEESEDEAIPDFSQTLVESETIGDLGISPRVAMGNDLDIDAALASVASLSDVIAEREAEEAAEQARMDAEAQAADEAQRRRSEYYFPRPPMGGLVRGQLASIVPALTLIAVGAWLTFSLSTTETPLDQGIVTLVLLCSIGICLLAYWLTHERWSYGAVSAGIGLILSGMTLFYLSRSSDVGIADGWTLIIAVWGLAILLGGLLSRGIDRIQQLAAGLLLAVAGFAGFSVTANLLPQNVQNSAANIGLPLLVIAGVLIIALLVLRRRR